MYQTQSTTDIDTMKQRVTDYLCTKRRHFVLTLVGTIEDETEVLQGLFVTHIMR